MARNQNTEETVETEAAEAAPTHSTNQIMLDVPEGDPSGLSGNQPRTAVIRALASTGEWTRGEIAKHITKLQFPNGEKKVPYQIVFQATKNIPNVKMAERGGAGATEAAETAEAAE